ncbi:MAG: glycoside hydrolase family 3 N-terminal domain-containing protein, partial [Acutalibacteraceae bacterium]|nr:glycoside hydrolase family 3 N-terminal domain-containing protein [Acutalibacteraceae bacterium]
DFLPFISGIDAGADSVMVSHNIITAVDPNLPASLSKPVHDLLRNELAFDGIIITDDMAMAAAEGYKEPYKTAVLAGNDMIIVSDFVTAYNEVLNAVRNGEIPEEMINAAVDRIINAKIKRGII